MGADPVTLPLIIAGVSAAATTAASANQARQQNNMAKDQAERVRKAKSENDRQRAIQLSVEQQKAVRQAQQVSGRIRTAAAEAGTGLTGSFAALDNQAGIDNGRVLQGLSISNAFAAQSSASQLDANLAEIASRRIGSTTVISQGIQGALSGFSTGLSIAGSMQAASQAQQQKEAMERMLRLNQFNPNPYDPTSMPPPNQMVGI
jgi:hypothetical protein